MKKEKTMSLLFINNVNPRIIRRGISGVLGRVIKNLRMLHK